MKLRHSPYRPLLHCSLILSSLVNWQVAQAEGGIVTDGSMGATQSLQGSQVTIPQDLGTTLGQNLFHSFTDFNVNQGQAVTFTENSQNALSNVIARVTGDSRSDINGTLSVTPGGQANFFLLNPNGILFGQGAVLDVQGAFHASTASQLNFADGKVFSAENPVSSSLSSVEPASFGFLASSVNNNGLLEVKDTTLAVKPGKSIDLVAGKIELQNATLLAGQKDTETTTPVIDSGEVRLVATQGANNISVDQSTGALPLLAANPSVSNAGDIKLQDSSIKTSGNSGGRIALWGKDVTIAATDTSKGINAINTGSRSATAQQGIKIEAAHFKIDGITLKTNVQGSGNGGDIHLHSMQDIEILRGGRVISAGVNDSTGNTGNLSLIAGRDLIVDGLNSPEGLPSQISTRGHDSSSGKIGDVNIQVGHDVLLRNGGTIFSYAFDKHIGNTGNIDLNVDNDLFLDGGNTNISTVGLGNSQGNNGNINITTGRDLLMSHGGTIYSKIQDEHQGNSGSIKLTVGRDLALDSQNTSADSPTKIRTGAYNNSNGGTGDINISTGRNVSINNGGVISINTNGSGMGNSGNMSVQANGDILFNAGNIFSSVNTKGNSGTIIVAADGNIILSGVISAEAINGERSANQGTVNVKAKGNLTLTSNGGITSYTFANRNAANLDVIAGKNLIVDGVIESRNTNEGNPEGIVGTGNSGDVSVHAVGDISLTGSGKEVDVKGSIFSSPLPSGKGNAGNIDLSAGGKLTLVNTGLIDAGTLSDAGHGGNVTINVKGDILLDDQSHITSNTSSKANAGNINIISDGNLTLSNTGFISTTTAGDGSAGNILVDVKGNVKLLNVGSIFSSSLTLPGAQSISNGNPGKVTVQAQGDIQLSGSSMIDTLNDGLGKGGDVKVTTAGNLLVKDSSIDASTTRLGAAGNVEIKVNSLSLLDKGYIASASFKPNSSGQTGQIHITADNTIAVKGGAISIQNEAVLTEVAAKGITPGTISLSARDIHFTSGRIFTDALGNTRAGDINISFAHWLTQDADSSIQSTAASGSGGAINITGGELLSLRKSSLITTVKGGFGNGGNINVTADTLLMDTGLIQANASSGNGGDIQLNLKALVPSGDQHALQIGGSRVTWQPYVPTFNVIQAVSETGVSGIPNNTAPQLNLSGVLANLGSPLFDTSAISQEYCNLGAGSTLTRQGKGGFLPKGNDWLF